MPSLPPCRRARGCQGWRTQGEYLASESSFYRILHEAGQMDRRGKAKAQGPEPPPPDRLGCQRPNQLWGWDITYLASTVAGLFVHLYLI